MWPSSFPRGAFKRIPSVLVSTCSLNLVTREDRLVKTKYRRMFYPRQESKTTKQLFIQIPFMEMKQSAEYNLIVGFI